MKICDPKCSPLMPDRGFDMAMLEMHNGKERDMNDWTQLLDKAGNGLRLTTFKQPPSSRLALLEIERDPHRST